MNPKQIAAIMEAVQALNSMLDDVDAHHMQAKPEDSAAIPEGSPAEEASESPETESAEADDDSPDGLFGDKKPSALASILGDDAPEEDEEDDAPAPFRRR